MRILHAHPKFLRLAAGALVAAALAVAAAPSAFADGMAGMSAEEHAHMSAAPAGGDHGSMPGMSAQEHARMSGARDHGSMPGMSAQEHARMSGGSDHGSMPGMDMSGHDEPPATAERPVALVLGGFGALIALVLGYAAVIRRRPAARRRREALARVRSTPPVPTVPAPAARNRGARP